MGEADQPFQRCTDVVKEQSALYLVVHCDAGYHMWIAGKRHAMVNLVS